MGDEESVLRPVSRTSLCIATRDESTLHHHLARLQLGNTTLPADVVAEYAKGLPDAAGFLNGDAPRAAAPFDSTFDLAV